MSISSKSLVSEIYRAESTCENTHIVGHGLLAIEQLSKIFINLIFIFL